MPVFTIDAPSGAPQDAKHKMMKEVTEALHEAWPIPDTRGWLREYPADNVSQDGRIQAEPMRPVCSLEAPELTNLESNASWCKRSSPRSRRPTRASPIPRRSWYWSTTTR